MDQPTFSQEGREINKNEKLAILWTIPDFGNRVEAANANPDVNAKKFVKAAFSAGEISNGLKPHWEFFLAVGLHRTIHIGLEYSGRGNCPAECDVYFRTPTGKLLHASTLEKQDYTRGSIVTCRLDQNISWNDNLDECIQNEVLQLQLNVTVPTPIPDEMHYKMEILKVFKKGLDSGVGSDVIFVFEEEGSGNVIEGMRAHKAILSFHSPVFAEMFGKETEGTLTRVKITEMTPQGMDILLQFLYSGEMDENWKSAVSEVTNDRDFHGDSPCVSLLHRLNEKCVVEELIQATQKYQMEQLRTFLRENIASALTVKNVWNIRRCGEKYAFPEVVEAASKFMMGKLKDCLRSHNLGWLANLTIPKDG